MKFARIIDILFTRNMRCPICQRKFEDTQKKNVFEIRKKSIVLHPPSPEISYVLSSVNNSAKIRLIKKNDKFVPKEIFISCSNSKHRYSMMFSFYFNTYKLETENAVLRSETIGFNDRKQYYGISLDWEKNISRIGNPSSGQSIEKPGCLQFRDKHDLIQKIDRLFNFA